MLQVFKPSPGLCWSHSWRFFSNHWECTKTFYGDLAFSRKFDRSFFLPRSVMSVIGIETFPCISVQLGTFNTRTNYYCFMPSAYNTRTTFCGETIIAKLKKFAPTSMKIKKILTGFSNFLKLQLELCPCIS